MVNLSEAKSGDVVHFRCGGSAEIESISDNDRFYQIVFKRDEFYISFNIIGICQMTTKLIDIVKVESK